MQRRGYQRVDGYEEAVRHAKRHKEGVGLVCVKCNSMIPRGQRDRHDEFVSVRRFNAHYRLCVGVVQVLAPGMQLFVWYYSFFEANGSPDIDAAR
jgi:hypothetical protein